MTSLHPAAVDPSLPGPPGDGAGSSPPPAMTDPPAAAAPVCSIATVVEPGAAVTGFPEGVTRQAGSARPDSVPQPRSRYDAEAPPVLPDAYRRPVPDVAALLGLDARAEEAPAAPADRAATTPDALRGPNGGEAGFVRFGSATAPSEGGPSEGGPSVPTQRSVREEPRILGSRRPSPSRRLRRMHPLAGQNGQGATARETAASGPAGTGLPGATGRAHERAGATGAAAQEPSSGAGTPGASGAPGVLDAGPAGVDAAIGHSAGASWAEPPLGILIGAGPAEAFGRPEERAPVRVAARPIRVGRGTCLVVLPSWRPAIAVSVSTDQLLTATGLGFDQLIDARLTVLMNPAALHDRELELHGWEPGPAGRSRRGRA